MRILLTGTSGKVGGYLARYWQGNHEIIPLTRQQVELSDEEALRKYLHENDFDLLVNPAAISTPEGCEQEPALAHVVNVTAPEIMATICAERKTPFIHFSTDYVLDGSEPGFKSEDAPCHPNNLYGKTKLASERAVLAVNPQALVARVSWVFGSAGEGFLEKIFRQIREGIPLEGVADKYSLPSSAREIAHALDYLLIKNEHGLYHLTQSATEPVSWHRYAVEVATAVHEIGLTPDVLPVKARQMAEIPVLRTHRPVHTAMKPSRLHELGFPVRNWQEVLRERVRELAK